MSVMTTDIKGSGAITKYRIIVARERGNFGAKGQATDAQLLEKEKVDTICAFGTGLMMKEVLTLRPNTPYRFRPVMDDT